MDNALKLIFVLIVFLAFVNVAFAEEVNSTEIYSKSPVNTSVSTVQSDLDVLCESQNDSAVSKSKPVVSIDSAHVKSKDSITIRMTDKDGKILKQKKLTATIKNKKYELTTNSKGIAKLKVNLPKGTYKLTLSSLEDDNFTAVSKSFNVNVVKLSTKILHYSNFVLNKNYYYVFLKDEMGNPVPYKKLIIRVNGKNHICKTNKYGRAAFKVNTGSKMLAMHCKFPGDKFYRASYSKVVFFVNQHTSLEIGNSKLITGGYLRVYLKDLDRSKYWKKTIKITVGKKRFSKKTDCEGIVVIKPKMGVGKFKVTARFGKYYTSKILYCYKHNAEDPLSEAVPMKNGVPDVDVMPANFVWGDGSRTYTLTKAQYNEVLKRDSYCLFLKNKLTKYTFFKTKAHPNTNYIIKREKWNVIEKAINQKLVDANRHNYWPSTITVSLKGKAYTYPEVRDWQDTPYTCGPTSCSMCSQVLKNYLSESYIARHSGTTRAHGTACSGMIKALERNNFNCTYYYRDSYVYALRELKKGGCALVFHAKNHYVAILDISSDGKRVLVSNSYGSYDAIDSKWLSVGYMKTRYYKNHDDGLIVRLNYKLSKSVKNQINSYYSSMGPNWTSHNTREIVT